MIKTNAIFKCIVTLKEGGHKILRLTIDKVASFVYLFRTQQQQIFKNESYVFDLSCNEYLAMSEVKSVKFINERTKQLFLSID